MTKQHSNDKDIKVDNNKYPKRLEQLDNSKIPIVLKKLDIFTINNIPRLLISMFLAIPILFVLILLVWVGINLNISPLLILVSTLIQYMTFFIIIISVPLLFMFKKIETTFSLIKRVFTSAVFIVINLRFLPVFLNENPPEKGDIAYLILILDAYIMVRVSKVQKKTLSI